ncbi:MAG: AMP-binding protein [Acidimicrobiales bacterium]
MTWRLRDVVWSAGVLGRSGLMGPWLPDQLLGMGLSLARYGPSVAAHYAVGAARSSRQAAVIDEAGTLSFGELDDRTTKVADGLARAGVVEGDRVAVLCRNHRGFVQATVGLSKLGATAVFLNTGLAPPQLAEVVFREGCAAVIVDEDLLTAAGLMRPRVVRILSESVEAMATRPGRCLPPVPDHSGGQTILTSGTTGTPKGARLAGPSQVGPLLGILAAVPLRRRDVVYVAPPLYHAWGFFHLVLAGVVGETVVLRRRFDPEATLALIQEHRVTALAVVPVMLQRLLDLPEATRAAYDTSSLRVVVSSGAPLPGDLATRFMDTFGDVLYNLFGSTEVAWATVASPADLRAAPSTAGRPPRGTVVRLVGDDGAEVGTGAVGRILVENGLAFAGYTTGGSKPVLDGLMGTGDLGRFNDAGLLFVEGREDDMIVSGGENVYPGEVENLLLTHPGVAEACVVGVADPEWGQRLRAYVVPRAGVSGAPAGVPTAEALQDFVRGRLARYQVPRDLVFVQELPYTTTGKVLRRVLAEERVTKGPISSV